MAVNGIGNSGGYYNAAAYFSSDTEKSGETDATTGSGNVIDAVFEKETDRQVSIDDFLLLMVEQLKNQDFMNPVDDTQYVTQLAQFTTMQQMQELAYNAKSTYATSLVGKDVTAAKISVNGDLLTAEGPVEKVSLLDGQYMIYVDGKGYTLDEIMEVKPSSQKDLMMEKISGQLDTLGKMLDTKLTEGFEGVTQAVDPGKGDGEEGDSAEDADKTDPDGTGNAEDAGKAEGNGG